MPNQYNLATPLAANPNMAAIVQVLRDELALIDFTKMFVYLFDIVDESLLDILIKQFDMDGFNGGFLADTPQKKRDLLKRTAEIKRYAGTPYSIKEAARALGIQGNITIIEGLGSLHDGSNKHDGTTNHGGGNWAKFIVNFSAADNPGLTATQIDNFRQMVEVLKPARSVLVGINLV